MKYVRCIGFTVAAVILAAGLYLYIELSSGQNPALPTISLEELAVGQSHGERWYKPASGKKIFGVALVAHGLNLKPEMMEPVIAILNSAGIEALNVSLRGHGDNFLRSGSSLADEKRDRLESFKKVNLVTWHAEIHQAYLKVMLRARKLGTPVFFVGYSLGGLLGCDLLAAQPGVHFDRMALFAPAITPHPSLVYRLKPLGPFPEFVIDSDSPIDQRANDGTPVAGYAALFDTAADLTAHLGPRLNVPTLVFMDKEDEFVSFEQLQEFIRDNGFDRWEIAAVAKDNSSDTAVPHHMILNERSLGPGMWQEVGRKVRAHFVPGNPQCVPVNAPATAKPPI